MICHCLYSDKDLVTVEDKASLLNNYLTINVGELKLKLLMDRWTPRVSRLTNLKVIADALTASGQNSLCIVLGGLSPRLPVVGTDLNFVR
jgi:hypothetical protein